MSKTAAKVSAIKPKAKKPEISSESSAASRSEAVTDYKIAGLERDLNEHLDGCANQYRYVGEQLNAVRAANVSLGEKVAELSGRVEGNAGLIQTIQKNTLDRFDAHDDRFDTQDEALKTIIRLIFTALVAGAGGLGWLVWYLLQHPITAFAQQ